MMIMVKPFACIAVDKKADIKNITGLVNSASLFSPGKKYSKSFTMPDKPGKVFRMIKPIKTPAKVIRLGIEGYPFIITEMVIWPKKNVKKLCKDIASFELVNGRYQTKMILDDWSSPSRTATKYQADHFPALYNKAMQAIHDGQAFFHTIDKNGVTAITELKKLFRV